MGFKNADVISGLVTDIIALYMTSNGGQIHPVRYKEH
jgi:hypothetical protein